MYNIQNASTCDVSTIFSAPPSAGAEVSVNGYKLVPSPFVNINVEKNIVNDTIIGGVWKIQLNGTVTGKSFNQVAAGCSDEDGSRIDGNKASLKKILELSKNSCCVHVIIKCGCDFIDGYGRILSASISEGNDPTWVTRGSYSIEIELYNNKDADSGKYLTVVSSQNAKCPQSSSDPNPSPSPNPCSDDLALKDLNESFTVSIDEDTFNWGLVNSNNKHDEKLGVGRRHIKVGFSISAKGLGGGGSNGGNCLPDNGGTGTNTDPTTYFGLAAAEKYLKCRIDKLKNMDLSGISGMPNEEIVPAFTQYKENSKSYLDFRSLEVNPIDQSMSLTGDIIYRPDPSGCHPDVFTSINVEEGVDNEGSQITISGNIEGLAYVSYATNVNPDIVSNLIACSGTGLITGAPLCDYNDKMNAANKYFRDVIDNEELLKDIAMAHCNKPVLVVKCVNEQGEGEILPCVSESPQPTPSFMCGNIQLISRQVSRDYAAGSINFTFIFTNKEQDCSSIAGVSSLNIEATHDLPRDNIVETVVPGRGKKGVLIQNLCCLSADRWSFDVNMTLSKSKKIPPLRLKHCARQALEKFIEDNNIDPNPFDDCWFVTDHQENLGNKSYKYSIQFTKPSC